MLGPGFSDPRMQIEFNKTKDATISFQKQDSTTNRKSLISLTTSINDKDPQYSANLMLNLLP